MRRLFVVICALVAYGSLYPWDFSNTGSVWSAVEMVLLGWPHRLSWHILKDLVLNLVVYAPIGLLGYFVAGRGRVMGWRLAWPVVFGFLFSWTMEILQAYLPLRTPSILDVLCNTLGSAGGVGLGWAYETTLLRMFERLAARTVNAASALMMLLVGAGRFVLPLVPSLYLMLRHRPFSGPDQAWSWVEFGGAVASWLMAARFLEALASQWTGGAAARRLTLLLLSGALGLGAMAWLAIPELAFSPALAVGALAGVGIFVGLVWFTSSPSRDRALACIALVWLLGEGLRPYHFEGINSFEWIPFYGLLRNDWLASVASLLDKAWMYGSMYWMAERAGVNRVMALVSLLLILGAIEFAQQFLPGRISTMTDPAMGLIAAGLLWAVETRYERKDPAPVG